MLDIHKKLSIEIVFEIRSQISKILLELYQGKFIHTLISMPMKCLLLSLLKSSETQKCLTNCAVLSLQKSAAAIFQFIMKNSLNCFQTAFRTYPTFQLTTIQLSMETQLLPTAYLSNWQEVKCSLKEKPQKKDTKHPPIPKTLQCWQGREVQKTRIILFACQQQVEYSSRQEKYQHEGPCKQTSWHVRR